MESLRLPREDSGRCLALSPQLYRKCSAPAQNVFCLDLPLKARLLRQRIAGLDLGYPVTRCHVALEQFSRAHCVALALKRERRLAGYTADMRNREQQQNIMCKSPRTRAGGTNA